MPAPCHASITAAAEHCYLMREESLARTTFMDSQLQRRQLKNRTELQLDLVEGFCRYRYFPGMADVEKPRRTPTAWTVEVWQLGRSLDCAKS